MEETPKRWLPLFVDGLVIRRIGPSDFGDLLEIWSDPEVARYQFWGPYSPEQVTATIDAQRGIRAGDPGVAFVLAAELDRKVIGECQLTVTSVDDRQAEIGFAFNSRFTGRGYASRTVATVLGFAFIQLGVHRVVAGADVRNERSSQLMERIGMRREAHFIHDAYAKGEWVDTYVYAMLDHEWLQRHPELAQAVDG